ncbi:hypothetical protein Acr_00g0038960 [Actinidia rufa]|uniref:Uncharacterized protein n=1 Tax=Actinidia rufa TaxID=165716 RepID=A0A7J0DHF5_9ERIC|nr:hypothetical protein Acr_00g0038960 [Actinidia rufa]
MMGVIGAQRDIRMAALSETITDERVTDEMNANIIAQFTEKEVRDALFQMHCTKSPGPDGKHAIFFQRFWHIVSSDIMDPIYQDAGVSLGNEADAGKPFVIRQLKHLGILEKVVEVTSASKNQDVYVESMFLYATGQRFPSSAKRPS